MVIFTGSAKGRWANSDPEVPSGGTKSIQIRFGAKKRGILTSLRPRTWGERIITLSDGGLAKQKHSSHQGKENIEFLHNKRINSLLDFFSFGEMPWVETKYSDAKYADLSIG